MDLKYQTDNMTYNYDVVYDVATFLLFPGVLLDCDFSCYHITGFLTVWGGECPAASIALSLFTIFFCVCYVIHTVKF